MKKRTGSAGRMKPTAPKKPRPTGREAELLEAARDPQWRALAYRVHGIRQVGERTLSDGTCETCRFDLRVETCEFDVDLVVDGLTAFTWRRLRPQVDDDWFAELNPTARELARVNRMSPVAGRVGVNRWRGDRYPDVVYRDYLKWGGEYCLPHDLTSVINDSPPPNPTVAEALAAHVVGLLREERLRMWDTRLEADAAARALRERERERGSRGRRGNGHTSKRRRGRYGDRGPHGGSHSAWRPRSGPDGWGAL